MVAPTLPLFHCQSEIMARTCIICEQVAGSGGHVFLQRLAVDGRTNLSYCETHNNGYASLASERSPESRQD